MLNDIWFFWWQGYHDMPPIVKACYQSLLRFNSDYYYIRFIDCNNISNYLQPRELQIIEKIEHPTFKSDLVRLFLLVRFGGIWSDATNFFISSLKEWLSPRLKSGLFFCKKPTIFRLFTNSFIAVSAPNNLLLSSLLEASLEYWATRSYPDYYYWMDPVLKKVLKQSETVRKEFLEIYFDRGMSIHCLSYDYSLLYKPYDVSPATAYIIRNKLCPFLKLTYKTKGDIVLGSGSLIDYLINLSSD